MTNGLSEVNKTRIKEAFLNAVPLPPISATTNQTGAEGDVFKAVPLMTEHRTASLEAADLADAFLKAESFQTAEGLGLRCSGEHGQEWLAFNGRSYEVLPGHALRNRIVSFLRKRGARSRATKGLVDTIEMHLSAICAIPHTVRLPARFTDETWVSAPDSIILSNGILDLGAVIRRDENVRALTPHSPNFVGTVELPYDYDLSSTCPAWHKFLDSIFPNDEESRQFLREIFGYCLTYDISQEKFFIFEGTGANGKSTCLKVLAKLLGEANVSAVPLERFGEKHDLMNTLGKLSISLPRLAT